MNSRFASFRPGTDAKHQSGPHIGGSPPTVGNRPVAPPAASTTAPQVMVNGPAAVPCRWQPVTALNLDQLDGRDPVEDRDVAAFCLLHHLCDDGAAAPMAEQARGQEFPGIKLHIATIGGLAEDDAHGFQPSHRASRLLTDVAHQFGVAEVVSNGDCIGGVSGGAVGPWAIA